MQSEVCLLLHLAINDQFLQHKLCLDNGLVEDVSRLSAAFHAIVAARVNDIFAVLITSFRRKILLVSAFSFLTLELFTHSFLYKNKIILHFLTT